ncbi:type VII secretion target [Williamsia herbipolensis]|uniref:Type VII secretion target n=1 Tax=Williamsia herbipolensis TaxID=1603258 RepID=A0AAU4JZ52_9NOCA|nr:type VII secretion target [Williamsia herbipolensis]
MSEVLEADLDAIRDLAGQLRTAASDVRGLDAAEPFTATVDGLAGSDTASACSTAVERIVSALREVAGRVDVLSDANRSAADTIGLADDTYARDIAATLNLSP